MNEMETGTDGGPGGGGRSSPPWWRRRCWRWAAGPTWRWPNRAAGPRTRRGPAPRPTGAAGPPCPPSPGGTPPGIAPGEPDPSGDERYRVGVALPKAPETAHAYRAQGRATAADAARLAKALGLAGAPVKGPVGWRVGPEKDGSGPSLSVYESGDWRYEARGPSTDDCRPGKQCGADPTAAPRWATRPRGGPPHR
ncbi:hypothetical protein LUX12_17040 [Streptomyces somaliensis]|uniref:hypothetical protein n=1 Tax=Streptomyces somaliensis TaxID=78355 RepID=UPI0020CD46A2|nr:hypothetical protein [Streptomyces somaliensis]MCP9946121.1 hypothetical protein [Streptomyces somaliensis]